MPLNNEQFDEEKQALISQVDDIASSMRTGSRSIASSISLLEEAAIDAERLARDERRLQRKATSG